MKNTRVDNTIIALLDLQISENAADTIITVRAYTLHVLTCERVIKLDVREFS